MPSTIQAFRESLIMKNVMYNNRDQDTHHPICECALCLNIALSQADPQCLLCGGDGIRDEENEILCECVEFHKKT